MPLFRLETNVPRSKITPEFLDLTRTVLSETIGREKEVCHVEVIPDLLIAWDDSPAPAGNATLLCVGYLSPESNIRHTAALSEHLFKHLGIASDRLLIEFNDVKDTYLGWSGSTVADIFKVNGVSILWLSKVSPMDEEDIFSKGDSIFLKSIQGS